VPLTGNSIFSVKWACHWAGHAAAVVWADWQLTLSIAEAIRARIKILIIDVLW
jgi:hypothetical protein